MRSSSKQKAQTITNATLAKKRTCKSFFPPQTKVISGHPIKKAVQSKLFANGLLPIKTANSKKLVVDKTARDLTTASGTSSAPTPDQNKVITQQTDYQEIDDGEFKFSSPINLAEDKKAPKKDSQRSKVYSQVSAVQNSQKNRQNSKKKSATLKMIEDKESNLLADNSIDLVNTNSILTDPAQNPKEFGIGKRNKQPKIDKHFSYLNGQEETDSDFIELKSKKRNKKASSKTVKKAQKVSNSQNTLVGGKEVPVENERRKVPDGISVFDLIMPWKAEVIEQKPQSSIEKEGLAKIISVSGKDKVIQQNLSKHATDIQAVLINPPWENNFQNEQDNSKKACNKSNKKQKTDKSQKISIEQFKESFCIPKDVMKDGLVFIWVEKEIINDLIKCFEKQDFFYVENVCYVMLDQSKKADIDASREIDITDSYVREDSTYLKKTKRTLLIFRRMSQRKAKCNLELRHQRTCDVVFDWAFTENSISYNESDLINNDKIERSKEGSFKPNNYMYKMIETMLPKAMVDPSKKHIRLLEMWGQNDTPRRGWCKIVQN